MSQSYYYNLVYELYAILKQKLLIQSLMGTTKKKTFAILIIQFEIFFILTVVMVC